MKSLDARLADASRISDNTVAITDLEIQLAWAKLDAARRQDPGRKYIDEPKPGGAITRAMTI